MKRKHTFKQWRLVNILLGIAIIIIFLGLSLKNKEIDVMADNKSQVQQLADEANIFELKYAKEQKDNATMSARIKELEKQLKPTKPALPVAPKTVTKSINVVSLHPEIEAKITSATISAFGSEHVQAMLNIIKNESGFEPCKINGGAIDCNYTGSRACGLGQALSCSKLTSKCALSDVDCQVNWFINYTKERYVNPTLAWQHWLAMVPIDGRSVGHWW